ncbi:hypothetical protein PTTG_12470 [Puccinia triticina 1-1 BBBD Race 1]|uniref:START domain-containing protein n=2 Tax=Puccinia triticina TaxID=208348 RepID=A0A180GBN8_PUCT1|nr:uncharacterized protein PtA15_17A283 [Puccinia triticina]OAV90004.1 hypothetical protein PTTG_12470 [Puccinia triticina 1-1 BBBD Race 1]WAQ92801.1 hypothetical protein PtA15_17A283 [Puccinia triticina]WAR63704.1 hypothetical protein PtB15_17B305 [Puccinia triticina]
MPLSEYARSEYEEDSEFVMSDEEDDGGAEHSSELEPHHHQQSSPIDKPRLEILDDSLINPSLNSANRNSQVRSAPGSIISNDASKFINHVDLVMNKIKTLESDNRWHRVLKHRTGVQVYAQKHAKTIGKAKTVPVFKGVGLIKGYSPASVFAVIGSSKLWDEWYEDGNLVENLSDQVSLTYMCMKAGIGTRVRDLSLVEKCEATADGSIYFCASSVDTPRVPIVPGRIRAHIELNGWILEPIKLPESTPGASTTATKVTYYLQVNVKTFVAEAVSKRYLARRPLCITKIDAYLQKYGSPVQLEGISDVEAHPRQGGNRRSYSRNFMSVKQLNFPKELENGDSGPASAPNSLGSRGMRSHLSSIGPFGQKVRARLPSAAVVPTLKRSDPNIRKHVKSIQPEDTSSAPVSILAKPPQPLLIDHVKPNQESHNWDSISQALELFNTYLKDSHANQRDWKTFENSNNSVRMWLNSQIAQSGQRSHREGLFRFPVVKSQTILDTVRDGRHSCSITPEQVSLTVLSNMAQQTWDQNFHGYSKLGGQSHQHQLLLNTDNGFDQGTYLGTIRAVYPHIRDESMFCFDQVVFRQPADSQTVGSKIVILHHSVEDEEGYSKRLEENKDLQTDHPGANSLLREKVEQKLLSKIDVSGWVIESGPLSDQIQITHLSALSLNLKNQPPTSTSQTTSLPDFLTRLITSNIASRPQQVREFIRDHGFSPGFVRWADGEIQYDGDFFLEDSEQVSPGINAGQVEWRFRKKRPLPGRQTPLPLPSIKVGTGTIQTCWFQWSEQMYPHGIDLTLEPSDAAEVRLVSEMNNTLQFDWRADSESLVHSGSADGPMTMIKLRAKRIHSSDSSTPHRVLFNGSRSLDTVHVQLDPSKLKMQDAVESRDDRAGLEKDSATKVNGVHKDTSLDRPPTSAPQTSSKPGPLASNNPTNPPLASSVTLNEQKRRSRETNQQQQQYLFEPNVAIIINQDIYFTRSQVFFFIICLGFAYIYGRFG